MKITLSHEVNARMKALIDVCDTEINGLGKVVIDETAEVIRIVDIAVLKQKVSGVHADHDKEDLMKFFEERRKIGDAGQWKLQWHSHVNMGVFWSGTDETAIENIGHTADWLVSIVRNKKNECRVRVDVFRPVRLTFDNLSLEVATDDDLFRSWAQSQVDEKVEKAVTGVGFVRRVVETISPRKSAEGLPATTSDEDFDEYGPHRLGDYDDDGWYDEYDETGRYIGQKRLPLGESRMEEFYHNRSLPKVIEEAEKEAKEEDEKAKGDERPAVADDIKGPGEGKLATRRTKKKEEDKK